MQLPFLKRLLKVDFLTYYPPIQGRQPDLACIMRMEQETLLQYPYCTLVRDFLLHPSKEQLVKGNCPDKTASKVDDVTAGPL